MSIINQPFNGQLGDFLIDCLEAPDYDSLNIIVAFAKSSGVLRLKSAFERFKDRGSKINVYVGIDLDGTSYEALTTLRLLSDALYVIHVESDQTFHSKIYNFTNFDKSIVVTGSNNLTAGGLWTNLESSSVLSLSMDDPADKLVQRQIDRYVDGLVSMSGLALEIRSQDDIDALLGSGYISKEAKIRIRQRASKKKAVESGNKAAGPFIGRVNAPLPQLELGAVPVQSPQADAPLNEASNGVEGGLGLSRFGEEGPSIWFETRKMTGGSRNILDLSKKSLVKQGDPRRTVFSLDSDTMMKGGVQFFGIDPADEARIEDIIINYNGVDYLGNTIKYPAGSKANGTWRLQIKGESESGEKITEAFERNYLVGKVLSFTKVSEGYFFMSVFDDADLPDFIKASKVVAYNGGSKRSKLMGIL